MKSRVRIKEIHILKTKHIYHQLQRSQIEGKDSGAEIRQELRTTNKTQHCKRYLVSYPASDEAYLTGPREQLAEGQENNLIQYVPNVTYFI